MNVYFENSKHQERLIGTGFNQEECMNIIAEFLKEKGFKSYYQRTFKTDKGDCVDVGSHDEFFYIREE